MMGWKKIQIKFRGVCIVCKHEISPGNGALWSREEKCIKHLRWEQNDALAQGMNIVSVNKTCIVCEMPSPYNIVLMILIRTSQLLQCANQRHASAPNS